MSSSRTSLVHLHALLAALAILVLGCGSEAPPLHVGPAPWQDGEVATYDDVARGGAIQGTTVFRIRRAGEGWSFKHTKSRRGKEDGGEVTMAADLSPLHAARASGDKRIEIEYRATSIHSRTTDAGGATREADFPRPEGTFDNDQLLSVLRAIPFAPGFEARAADFVAQSGASVPMRVRVVGSESIEVPAGRFEAWHVKLEAGIVAHDAWYAKDPPRLLVRYRNPAAGAELALRSWVPAEGAAPLGNPAPAAIAPPREGPPSIRWPVALVTALVQLPLMLVFPVILGRVLRRRLGVPWKIWGIGAATFVASQIVHLPLNFALGLVGPPRAVGLWPLPALAVAAGLSAGLCEELARYLIMRRFLRDRRSHADALQFGAGHGGIESIVFGLLAMVSFAGMALAPMVASMLAPEQAESFYGAVEGYWQTPIYMPALGGLERLCAIALHVFLSVLVMRAVARRAPVYLLAAIALHALVDAAAVGLSKTLGALPTEGALLALALACLWGTWALRDRPLADTPAPAEGSR